MSFYAAAVSSVSAKSFSSPFSIYYATLFTKWHDWCEMGAFKWLRWRCRVKEGERPRSCASEREAMIVCVRVCECIWAGVSGGKSEWAWWCMRERESRIVRACVLCVWVKERDVGCFLTTNNNNKRRWKGWNKLRSYSFFIFQCLLPIKKKNVFQGVEWKSNVDEASISSTVGLGRDCRTVVKCIPPDQEVVNSNPTGCWTFFASHPFSVFYL